MRTAGAAMLFQSHSTTSDPRCGIDSALTQVIRYVERMIGPTRLRACAARVKAMSLLRFVREANDGVDDLFKGQIGGVQFDRPVGSGER